MTTIENTEDLGPSDLGTLNYWEKIYAEELNNFNDHGDTGEVWFGKNNSLKIVRWIDSKSNLIKKNDKIIDIGCGNGMMLIELANKGFTELTGVDYSKGAVDLALAILKQHNVPNIKVNVCDILNLEEGTLPIGYKVAHDKGTYDAISLHPEDPTLKRQKYIENVYKILLPESYLILTSCNWTKEELKNHFRNHFEFLEELPTNSFHFGGHTGNTITQVIFKKI